MEHYKHIFVVLVYKNTDVLNGFFQSLEEKVSDYKVILVNSFYDDISEAACKKWAVDKECDFISVPNKGYGAGNNVGIKYAIEHYDFDFLVISNSDIIVKKLDALDKYIDKTAVIGPETIMLTGKRQNPGQGTYPILIDIYFKLCKIAYTKDSHFFITLAHICSRINKIITRSRIKLFHLKEIQVFSIHGSFFIMTKKAVMKLVPVFSDEMFLYNEELYLGLSAKQKGVPLFFSNENEVTHLEGASSTADFWKQFPQFKESFLILYGFIEEGRFL